MRTLNRISVYILKRYLLLFLGLSIMAFGVAFSIKAELGTSPISSVPYVVSLFAPLTVGTATILMHCVFILLQILILRRQYHPIQLMQLPVAFFFGYLTDFGVWAVQGISCSAYWQQWIVCLIGILLVATGVSLEVKAGVVVLAGEGVVLAICKAFPKIYWAPGRRAGRHGGGGRIGGADRKADWQSTGTVESGKGVGIPYSFFRTKSYCFLCASVV